MTSLPALALLLAVVPPPAAPAVEMSRPVSAGAFTAVEVPVGDARRFIAEWDKPGAHVDLHVTSRVAAGGSVTAFIVFKGCATDAKGACHVSAELSRTGPDGKVLGPATLQLIAGPPAPGLGVFMRSQAAPTFTFEGDPVGRYVLRAKVTDRVAGATVQLEQAVAYGP